jgi:mitogen-activated protein kinase kinase kinase 7
MTLRGEASSLQVDGDGDGKEPRMRSHPLCGRNTTGLCTARSGGTATSVLRGAWNSGIRLAALLLLLPMVADAAVDVVELLYEQREAGAVDAEQLVLANAPEALISRLSERDVRWDELTGFLQRAMLWDLGLVLTDAGRLVQVLVPCGRSMDAVFLSLEDVQSVAGDEQCLIAECTTRGATTHRFAASNCSGDAFFSVSKCVLGDDTGNAMISSVAGSVWAQDGGDESVADSTTLNMRVYAHQDENALASEDAGYPHNRSNVTTNGSNLFTIHQVPVTTEESSDCLAQSTFVVPCVPHDLSSASDWCEPETSSFLTLWIEKERVTAKKASTAGVSRGTVALVFVLGVLGLIVLVIAGLYIYLSKCRRPPGTPMAAVPESSSSRVPFLSSLAARMPTLSLSYERRNSMPDDDSYLRSSKEPPSSKLNSSNSSSSAFFVDVASSAAELASGDADGMDATLLRDSAELRSFCSDAQLMKKRIPYAHLTFSSLLARGANGEVWSGSFHGRVVAIKSLLPEKRHDKVAIRLFAHEIRLASALAHPNIVRFLGLSWRRLSDLCIVSEFMAQGDLSELISAKLSGRMSWNREKLSIAIDMAEALVYLHSRSPCIIHRDLKSLNVLLDDRLRAKLSDFGLSRERSFEETMTNGVGTLLWTAPEILRGEPYAEKADIYSYGIVLSELDTCLPPFSLNDEVGRQKLSTMQLMHLVTRAQLAPKLRGDCPEALQRLTLACAAPEPAQRPSALQIVFTLRAISGALRYDG